MARAKARSRTFNVDEQTKRLYKHFAQLVERRIDLSMFAKQRKMNPLYNDVTPFDPDAHIWSEMLRSFEFHISPRTARFLPRPSGGFLEYLLSLRFTIICEYNFVNFDK